MRHEERKSDKKLSKSSSFFKIGEIFVQLDELDEVDRITHEWIEFNYIVTQTQKTF